MEAVPSPGRPGRYEVVVSGAVGPAVRTALAGRFAGPARWSTIVRVPADDVTDLLRALHDHRFDVEAVVLVTGDDIIPRA